MKTTDVLEKEVEADMELEKEKAIKNAIFRAKASIESAESHLKAMQNNLKRILDGNFTLQKDEGREGNHYFLSPSL